MISKNYCSLSSRLGFHFSIVEALVSERTSENYASFQFKGGAADWERRLKRVAFIGRLLEESGFRVQLREDSLIARIEDHQTAHMLARLRVLGYVTIHTRQLDMIMLNQTSVGRYGARLRQDIDTLLAAD
jgi:pyruvate,water dikinase